MNRCVEFHDSDVSNIDKGLDVLLMSFDSAYVHSSLGRPGIDDGEGHVQAAELVFRGVVCGDIPADCIGTLSDGAVRINGVAELNGMPVPFRGEGDISAEFVFCTGATLKFTATSVSFSVHGPSRFVETFAA